MNATSGIAAVLRIGDSDRPSDIFSRMMAAESPPGIWQWREDGDALLAARGPDGILYHHAASNITVAFDGRIDNLEALESTLGFLPDGPSAVRAAYVRDGVDGIAALLGDFAFVLWDATKRRLVCARDFAGHRPLFYSANTATLVAASELRQILRCPRVSAAVNEGMIAEHLTGTPVTAAETLWRDIRRVPPAHALTATAGGMHVTRYWDFAPEIDRSFGSLDAAAAELKHLLTQAIACRTRGARRVGVLLSGGVDSSIVAGAAHRLSMQGAMPAVHPLSVVFPGEPCDESGFIDAVVSFCALDGIRQTATPVPRRVLEDETARWADVPSPPTGSALLDPLRRAAVRHGIDVVLTGCGGDEWFTGRRRRGVGGRVRALIGRHMPAALADAIGAARGADPFPWIRPDLRRRVALRDRLGGSPQPRFQSHVQRVMHRVANSAAQLNSIEFEHRAAQAEGLRESHPFFDRRVAAFGFGLPGEYRWQPEQTKVVLRRAFAGMLPRSVVERTDKAEFSSVFMGALESLGGLSFFSALRAEAAGWVDGQEVRSRYERALGLYRRGDASYIPLVDGLWETASLELWLTHVKENRQAV